MHRREFFTNSSVRMAKSFLKTNRDCAEIQRRNRFRGPDANQRSQFNMRPYIMAAVIAGVLIPYVTLAQDGPWKPCPRCQTNAQRTAATKDDKTHPFGVHDLSGMWGRS